MPVGQPRRAGATAGVASGAGVGKGTATPTKPQNLQRVSPGVYRNAQGGLVNSSGGALPGQRPQQPPPQRPPMNNPAPRPGQNPPPNNGNMPSNAFPMPGGYERSAVMPDRGFQGNYPSWTGPGNGPGSPYDINPWYNPNQPMNDLMYRYPQGQNPNFGNMFRGGGFPGGNFGNFTNEMPQQPNSVSGLLQQGGQQQGTSMISEEAAAQARSSPYYNNPQANPYWKPYNS